MRLNHCSLARLALGAFCSQLPSTRLSYSCPYQEKVASISPLSFCQLADAPFALSSWLAFESFSYCVEESGCSPIFSWFSFAFHLSFFCKQRFHLGCFVCVLHCLISLHIFFILSLCNRRFYLKIFLYLLTWLRFQARGFHILYQWVIVVNWGRSRSSFVASLKWWAFVYSRSCSDRAFGFLSFLTSQARSNFTQFWVGFGSK